MKNLFKSIVDKLEILRVNAEIIALANSYISNNVVSQNYYDDSLHIAFATVYQLDMLVSWNFKHIVNFNKIRQINSVNLKLGYKSLEIYSPMEVVNE